MENRNVRNTKNRTESKVINEWLKQYSGTSSYYKHREGLQKFLSFLGKNIGIVLKEYKRASDKNQWARDMGLRYVASQRSIKFSFSQVLSEIQL